MQATRASFGPLTKDIAVSLHEAYPHRAVTLTNHRSDWQAAVVLAGNMRVSVHLSTIPLVLTAAIGIACSDVGAWADEPCDHGLQPIPGSLGYVPRQTNARCEGLYESPVRAINLELVSLLVGRLAFDATRDSRLIVTAPMLPEAVAPVRLRALALPLRTYYRMDAVLAPGASLQWPITDVLHGAGLQARDLGLFGWSGEGTEKIWLPLAVRIEGQEPPTGAQPIELKLRSPVRLERLNWRLYACSDAVPAWQVLAEHGVREGETVSVVLPAGPPGIVCIDFSAKRSGTDDWLTPKLRVFRPS